VWEALNNGRGGEGSGKEEKGEKRGTVGKAGSNPQATF